MSYNEYEAEASLKNARECAERAFKAGRISRAQCDAKIKAAAYNAGKIRNGFYDEQAARAERREGCQ